MRTRRVRTGINHFWSTQKSLCAHSTERQESILILRMANATSLPGSRAAQRAAATARVGSRHQRFLLLCTLVVVKSYEYS